MKTNEFNQLNEAIETIKLLQRFRRRKTISYKTRQRYRCRIV